jgi:6-phosphogluconolactonase
MKTFTLLLKICLVTLTSMVSAGCDKPAERAQPIKFFVGSSNGNLSHSIILCELDPASEAFSVLDSFAGARGASYLDLDPERKFLYAINQERWEQTGNSSVSSFAVEPGTLALEAINSQSSQGSGICHVHCSRAGGHIFVANYGSGHATALPVNESGEIQAASSVVIGEGTGPNERRQEGPHAHQVMLDPGQNFLLVPDLGTDKVMIYVFDAASGSLTPNPSQASFSLPPGSGPRHLAFHPDGSFLYIVNELNSTITACSFNGSDGTMSLLNTEGTVEADHEGMKYPAAVRVHPSGKFVYASTRGENSCISTFEIGEDGRVSRIQVMEQVPNWPRDFNLDPSGRLMLVAGERSDEIKLYRVDPQSGLLSHTSAVLELPAPANVLFVD